MAKKKRRSKGKLLLRLNHSFSANKKFEIQIMDIGYILGSLTRSVSHKLFLINKFNSVIILKNIVNRVNNQ